VCNKSGHHSKTRLIVTQALNQDIIIIIIIIIIIYQFKYWELFYLSSKKKKKTSKVSSSYRVRPRLHSCIGILLLFILSLPFFSNPILIPSEPGAFLRLNLQASSKSTVVIAFH
jgi:hypothetical protein